MIVKIFSLKTCPYCHELKELMVNDQMTFTDLDCDLDENQQEYNDLVSFTQCYELPIVVVGDQVLIPDVSFRSIPEAFKLTKMILG